MSEHPPQDPAHVRPADGSPTAGPPAAEPGVAEVPAAGRHRRLPRWEWWHSRTTTTRRVLRTILTLALTFLVAAAFGVFTATTHSSLGPHEAEYAMTADSQIAIDLGPLGSVLIDSPLPWPLGVEVVVHEIPAELATVSTSPVTGLANDLAAYAQFFSAPDAAITDATSGLLRDAVGRTFVVWSVLLVLIAAARLASRGLLRTEVRRALGRPGVAALVGVLVLSVGTVQGLELMGNGRREGQRMSALAGTPLEDVRITGRMATLVDVYGGYVVDAYSENELFYAEVQDNVAAAYAADDEPLAPSRDPDPSPVPTPTATGTPGPGDGPTQGPVDGDDGVGPAPGEPVGPPVPPSPPPTVPPVLGPPDEVPILEPDGAAAPGAAAPGTATPAPGTPAPGTPAPGTPGAGADLPEGDAPGARGRREPTPDPEPVTFVMATDLHCNVGMAPVVGDVLRLSEARALLDLGDTVMSGTSVESYCVNAFAQAVPDGVQAVVATGNHDSVQTADQLREAGYTVLDGGIVEVAGVRVLGDTDPTLTAIGEGTTAERDETVPEMGQRLADVACEDDAVDLLLVHNPRGALPALERGCAPLSLSGH